ncbi:phage tail protein [Bartonella sp. AC66GZZY]|uniref:phage tail protein n=1 Tax=Bartonella sp. AC66GZZY TaxID=3243458 RepID=UPI0035D028A0
MLASDDTADSVTVEHFSKETWQTAEETVSLPDNTSDQPARVRLFGCTEKAQPSAKANIWQPPIAIVGAW